jgi:hypothetical protein
LKVYEFLETNPMKIKLVGALPQQLKDLGLKPGDKFNAELAENGKYGAALIRPEFEGETVVATVYQENYKKIW